MEGASKEKISALSSVLHLKKEPKAISLSPSDIAKNLPKATLIKTPPYLQAIFRKKTLSSSLKVSKEKSSLFKGSKELAASLNKEARVTEKCKENQPLRLSYLKRLMQKEGAHREYLLYKHTKQTSLKNQLQSIGQMIKSHYGDLDNLKNKNIKSENASTQEEDFLDEKYKTNRREPILNRITDFNKTS